VTSSVAVCEGCDTGKIHVGLYDKIMIEIQSKEKSIVNSVISISISVWKMV